MLGLLNISQIVRRKTNCGIRSPTIVSVLGCHRRRRRTRVIQSLTPHRSMAVKHTTNLGHSPQHPLSSACSRHLVINLEGIHLNRPSMPPRRLVSCSQRPHVLSRTIWISPSLERGHQRTWTCLARVRLRQSSAAPYKRCCVFLTSTL